MRKVCLIIVWLLLLTSLCGCKGKRFNYFVEGTFESGNYTLTVTAIGEKTFNGKSGINVVEDASYNRKNRYYEIVLTFSGDAESAEQLTFANLKIATVSAEPCYYTDDNGNSVSPIQIQNSVEYVIEYNGKTIIFIG